jgi:hypothetical protein
MATSTGPLTLAVVIARGMTLVSVIGMLRPGCITTIESIASQESILSAACIVMKTMRARIINTGARDMRAEKDRFLEVLHGGRLES